MLLKQRIANLNQPQEGPCVTITLNTHRTHPDNVQDATVLKNLCAEAEKTVLENYNKREVVDLVANLQKLCDEVDVNQNLASLSIFVSNNTQEVVRSMWPVPADAVMVGNEFSLRSLILDLNRTEHYLIMLLSRSGVHVFEAVNDAVLEEIKNEDFPFSESQHFHTDKFKISDAKQGDNMIREYFNKVDKALQKVAKEKDMSAVVVCTDENYHFLQQVSDKNTTYIGFSPVNYNETAPHTLAKQSWELVKDKQVQSRRDAVAEMQQAVSEGLVLTDPTEIYQAAMEGRGDLLITREAFNKRAVFNNGTLMVFESGAKDEPTEAFDLASKTAWEVVSKNGRAIFTANDDILELGNMALKLRYI